MTDERRLQLRGLHHVTAICADAERTVAFYRGILGMTVVRDGASDDDPGARHVWLGMLGAAPGQLLSFLEYPQLPHREAGVGSTHHFALLVESAQELDGWRDYLRGRGVECSEVFARDATRSLYVRDPDGHVVEIATRGPA